MSSFCVVHPVSDIHCRFLFWGPSALMFCLVLSEGVIAHRCRWCIAALELFCSVGIAVPSWPQFSEGSAYSPCCHTPEVCKGANTQLQLGVNRNIKRPTPAKVEMLRNSTVLRGCCRFPLCMLFEYRLTAAIAPVENSTRSVTMPRNRVN